MDATKSLFVKISKKNEASWSLMINGFVKNDCFEEALAIYHEMYQNGSTPNDAAVIGAITTCAHFGVLGLGREIHLSLNENKIQLDIILSIALVDMYAKCGCLEIASSLFDRIEKKNLGLAIHGKASECLKLFFHLLKDGLCPNSLTFTGILFPCAHASRLKEGKDYI
ncbi:pentatricopeptide repeat-containing protein At1g50270-like [Typha latifolia]|uniref:pentatricopeptide repeat-containing protein At1g50270-like n=1 Tax=Typha latifolia TaxID=4733 RepID=UPI003C2E2821